MTTITREDATRLLQRGRRAEQRGKWLKGLITGILTQILGALLGGWFLMLGVALLSADWWPAIPTMGYWVAVFAVGLLRGVFSRIPPAKAAS